MVEETHKEQGLKQLTVGREIHSSRSSGHLHGAQCVRFHGWIPATEGSAQFIVQDLSADLQ
jgi:hypothetical protein